MPVVLIDHTNRTWCVEDPRDDLLHAGFVGQAGPRLEDLLEFAQTRETQFNKFVEKKREAELKINHGKRKVRTQHAQSRRVDSVREE